VITEQDIDRIIAAQGFTMHIDVRVKARGDGTVSSYVHLRKRGLRGSLHLGALTKLLKMSEADQVGLADQDEDNEGVTMETTKQRRWRGFASLSEEERSRIASMGGKAARNRHRWTSEEAQNAGRKGGRASAVKRRRRGFVEEL